MDYWTKRILRDEDKAQKIAEVYAKKEEAYYRKILKDISKDIDSLYTKLENGNPITRSELWQYEHFKRLKNTIYRDCGQLGMDQVSLTEKALDKVVEEVLGVDWKDNTATGIFNRAQTK